MEGDKILICRLCLEVCKSGFEVIRDSTKETLNFLLLNLDLEITDEAVMCDSCIDSLKECLNSKIDCLRKSGSIFIKHEGLGLNIPEIHLTESAMNTPATFNNYDLCCYCKQLINHESSVLLVDEEKNVTAMLEKYFPELNINGTKNSMCMACYKSLENQLTFISKCLAAEEKIKEYCKAEGTNSRGQVELSNVVHFVSKKQLQNNICSSFSAVKLEKVCEETKKENKTEIKSEDLVKIDERRICDIEKEDIDIKMEQDEGDRPNAFQTKQKGCTELYSPSRKDTEEVKQFMCDICTYQTKLKYNFSRHLLIHKHPSEITMYKCQICTYQNRHKYKLSNHMLTHKDPSEVTMYTCEVCAYQTRLKGRLTEHMVTHKDSSEVVMHKCTVCTYQSTRKFNLSKHILRRHEPSNATTFKCEMCAYQCKLKYKLREHMMVHKDPSEIVMYKCEKCPFQTNRKYNLSRHILSHDHSSRATVYKCKICTYHTSHEQRLSKHMLAHKDPMEVAMYECEVCMYRTRYKSGISEHMLTHKDPSEVVMYKCELCTYQSKRKRDLSRHLLVHKTVS